MFVLKCLVLVGICISRSYAEAPVSRVRFPGDINIKALPSSTFQHEEPRSAPYPAAGFRPDPPFDLPTSQEPNFQPDQTYGPPQQTYGPPEQTYGPPDDTYVAPDQTYNVPKVTVNSPHTVSFSDTSLLFPTTLQSLPYVEQQFSFRPGTRRPAAFTQPLSSIIKERPNRVRPAKIIVSVGDQPLQGFAQLPPKKKHTVVVGDRIIAYRDHQHW